MILGEIEIKGHRVFITDESPPEWQRLIGHTGPITVRSSPYYSQFVGLNYSSGDGYRFEQTGQRVEHTLEKVQDFLSTCTPRIEEPAEGLTDSHPVHEIVGEDWQVYAAREFYLWAAKELNIEPPKDAKFFRKAAADEKIAFTTKQYALGVNTGDGVIWIREDRAGSGFIETVAHEVYHQLTTDEPLALAYGEEFAAKFGRIPSTAKLFFFPYIWDEEFHPFYTRWKEAPRGSWLINLKDGWVYERDASKNEWVAIKKFKD